MTTNSYYDNEQKFENQNNEYQSESNLIRYQILDRILEKGIRIPDGDLAECFNMKPEDIAEAKRRTKERLTMVDGKPITWDYAFVFEIGSEEEIRRPTNREKNLKPDNTSNEYNDEWENGVTQRKYYGQIMQEMKRDLERASLSVLPFKSRDGKYVIFCVGITEKALENWANERDSDLLLDPTFACEEGRKKGFQLALRTKLNDDEDSTSHTLPLSNWTSMYAQFNPRSNPKIYKHYHRISGDENSPMTCFDEKTRLRIIYEAIVADKGENGAEVQIQDHLLSKKHPLIACFPLHNQTVLDNFDKDWLKNCHIKDWMWAPLDRIRDYFGEPVAFYFAFLTFYLKWLIAPSCIGTLFFLIQIGYNSIDAPGIYIVCLFIILWCVAFVDFWLRQESRHRLQWGMTKFQLKAVSRPQFKGEWQHDEVTGLWAENYKFLYRAVKSFVTMSGILMFLTGCIAVVVTILLVRDASPKGLSLKIGLGIANGVSIAVFDYIYKVLSRYGNEWENHRTEQDFQDALITKSFFFKFFNSFSSLFYLAFIRSWVQGSGYYIRVYGPVCEKCEQNKEWDPDKLCDFTLTKDSSYSDFVKCCVKQGDYCREEELQNEINAVILSDLQIQLATLFVTAIFIQNIFEVGLPFLMEWIRNKREQSAAKERGEEVAEKSEAEIQAKLDPFENTIDDMSELIIQFGYVTLFVLALPITPLLALINNVLELKVDGINMVKSSQRPHPNGSFGLGAWNGVLSFFSIISVGTNVALVVFRTIVVNSLLGANISYKWIAFSIVSIVLALIVAAEKALIPDEPEEVTQAVSRQRLIESVLVMNAVVDEDTDEPPKTGEDDEDFTFDPSLPFIKPEGLELVPTGRLILLEKKNGNTQNNSEIEP